MRFWVGSQGSGLGDGFPTVVSCLGKRIEKAFNDAKVGEIDGLIIVFHRTSNLYEGVKPWHRRIRRSWTFKDILGRKVEFFNCFVDCGVHIADGEVMSRTPAEQYRLIGTNIAELLEYVFGKLDAGDRDAARQLVLSVQALPYEGGADDI